MASLYRPAPAGSVLVLSYARSVRRRCQANCLECLARVEIVVRESKKKNSFVAHHLVEPRSTPACPASKAKSPCCHAPAGSAAEIRPPAIR